jgi:hypothetical protein
VEMLFAIAVLAGLLLYIGKERYVASQKSKQAARIRRALRKNEKKNKAHDNEQLGDLPSTIGFLNRLHEDD